MHFLLQLLQFYINYWIFLLIYSSYEILGGATLVAVTDRNVDQIIKPKTLEKPHVTITIGDKQQAMMDPLAIGNF